MSPDSAVVAARRHAREAVEPAVALWEQTVCFPREAVESAARDGLCSLFVPREAGGAGLRYTDGIPARHVHRLGAPRVPQASAPNHPRVPKIRGSRPCK